MRSNLPQAGLILTGAIAISILSITSHPPEIQAQPATPLPRLQLGMQGSAVRTLQTILTQQGFYRASITGYFDARTETAVKATQQRYGLPANGVVNAATWQVLQKPRLRFVPPNRKAPGRREVAGRRMGTQGACPVADKRLTAIIPQTNIGLTVAQRPTFWFYIPYQPTPTIQAEFMLLDEYENEVYRTTFNLTGTPGIVSISLPSNVPPIKEGKNKEYRWLLSIICNPETRSQDISVNGYVQRVPLTANLRNELEKATTPGERILLYAENGLWYEALTNIIEERQKNPRNANIAGYWEDLLKSPAVKLERIVPEPIVSCCTQKN